MRIRLYIGCSLTQAPEEFRNKVEKLKQNLRKNLLSRVDVEILEFIGLVKGSAKLVYHWDIHECVGRADIFVAICDFPAIGLGYEFGVAVEKRGISVLAVAQEKASITRLVQGITHPNFTLQTYRDFEHLCLIIESYILTVVETRTRTRTRKENQMELFPKRQIWLQGDLSFQKPLLKEVLAA